MTAAHYHHDLEEVCKNIRNKITLDNNTLLLKSCFYQDSTHV